ncbi:MAG TPA: ATP-binding protein [Caulobacteraceae bacterium]|nr:ATP-binding protein [Caulobacteraceae bacterium]
MGRTALNVASRPAKAKLEPLLERLLASTRNAPVPMALFDLNRRFLAASSGWEQIAGLAGRDYLGCRIEEVIADVPADTLELHRRCAGGEHLLENEAPYVGADGDTRWLCCEYRPVRRTDQRPVGYFVHANDVTPLMEARREAQANAERLKLALGAARAGVSEFDFAARTQWFSPEFHEIIGAEVDFRRFAREPWYMAHPDDRHVIDETVARWKGRRHEPMDFRIVLPSGESRWVQAHAEQQLAPDGRRLKVVGLVLDIDARKRQELALAEARRQAQTNADRLGLALKAARAGVFEVNLQEKTFWCSPEFVEVAGRTMTFEEASSPAWPLVHPDDLKALLQAFKRDLSTTPIGSAEARLVLPSGEHRWVHICAEPTFDEQGRNAKVNGLVLDIDARKQQELALIAAEQAAQSAAEAKSQFLANMSHEIRTPMNGVLGVLHLLQREHLSEEGRQLLQEASDCGRMLSQLLDDVMDLSKIEAGKLELSPEPTDVVAVLKSVVGLLRQNAEGKGLELRARVEDEAVWIEADPVRLRQGLFNLIGNAIKFTEKGHVEVRLTARTEGEGSRLRFEIEDTGIGIPEAAQATLFHRFQQADGSTSRRFGGSGLGLAITRRLAEMMDGGVGFVSREGEGSTFWLEVSAPIAEPPAAVEQDDAAPMLEGLRALLVEDNATNRLVASKMLEALGVSVAMAEHGGLGVEAARTGGFDLILMDVQMPVMDGLEATRRIRALGGEAAATPIIGLTANAMNHQRDAYMAAGMDGLVAKPISPAALVAEIARVTCAPGRSHETAAA